MLALFDGVSVFDVGSDVIGLSIFDLYRFNVYSDLNFLRRRSKRDLYQFFLLRTD